MTIILICLCAQNPNCKLVHLDIKGTGAGPTEVASIAESLQVCHAFALSYQRVSLYADISACIFLVFSNRITK
jgi:hypothetical protein